METPHNSPTASGTLQFSAEDMMEFSKLIDLTLEQSLQDIDDNQNECEYESSLSLEMLALQSPHGSKPSDLWIEPTSIEGVAGKSDNQSYTDEDRIVDSNEGDETASQNHTSADRNCSKKRSNSIPKRLPRVQEFIAGCQYDIASPGQSNPLSVIHTCDLVSESESGLVSPIHLPPSPHSTPEKQGYQENFNSDEDVSNVKKDENREAKDNSARFRVVVSPLEQSTKSNGNNSSAQSSSRGRICENGGSKIKTSKVDKHSRCFTSHSKKKSPKHGGIYSLLLRKSVEAAPGNASQAVLVSNDLSARHQDTHKYHSHVSMKSTSANTNTQGKEDKKQHHGSIYRMLLDKK